MMSDTVIRKAEYTHRADGAVVETITWKVGEGEILRRESTKEGVVFKVGGAPVPRAEASRILADKEVVFAEPAPQEKQIAERPGGGLTGTSSPAGKQIAPRPGYGGLGDSRVDDEPRGKKQIAARPGYGGL